jgi:hypothetical protein
MQLCLSPVLVGSEHLNSDNFGLSNLVLSTGTLNYSLMSINPGIQHDVIPVTTQWIPEYSTSYGPTVFPENIIGANIESHIILGVLGMRQVIATVGILHDS